MKIRKELTFTPAFQYNQGGMKETVFITGSSKGLGKELALVFARNNFNVVIHGRNEKDLANVKNEVLNNGVECSIITGDLKSNEVINDIHKSLQKNNITVLINNAGSHCPRLPLEKINDTEVEELLITNLIIPIKLTKLAYTLFIENMKGTIININSLSGLECQGLRSIYCASKWGLKGFTDTLRLEAEKSNIKIIGVYPGRIKTKKEFTFGMDPKEVANEIYNAFEKNISEIILDKRPKE